MLCNFSHETPNMICLILPERDGNDNDMIVFKQHLSNTVHGVHYALHSLISIQKLPISASVFLPTNKVLFSLFKFKYSPGYHLQDTTSHRSSHMPHNGPGELTRPSELLKREAPSPLVLLW